MPRQRTSKIGKTQLEVLRCLRDHEGWYSGAGWVWGSPSTTDKVCQSLVVRGDARAEKSIDGSYRGFRYTITQQGRELLRKLRISDISLAQRDDEDRFQRS